MSESAQHELKQDEPEPEVDLARRSICSVDQHLHHVQHQKHDRDLGHVVVDPAKQPSTRHLVLNEPDAFPRTLGIRAVGGPEHNASDQLHHHREHERAAPDVPPAGATRNALVEHTSEEPAVSCAVVEPAEKISHQTGVFSSRPGRKFWNRTQTSSPLRTSTSSASMSRGLGLAGSFTTPSRSKLLR